MSPDGKIRLLDEVVSTAIASWRIYIVVDKKLSTWLDDERKTPEYEGCCTLKVLLCHSLMSAWYARWIGEINRTFYTTQLLILNCSYRLWPKKDLSNATPYGQRLQSIEIM